MFDKNIIQTMLIFSHLRKNIKKIKLSEKVIEKILNAASAG